MWDGQLSRAEILVDHPGGFHYQADLPAGTTLVGSPDVVDAAVRAGFPEDRGIRLTVHGPCCSGGIGLAVTAAEGGPVVLNAARISWFRQLWEDPYSNPLSVRRGPSVNMPAWPRAMDRAVVGVRAEVSRLTTFWPGVARDCWRVAMVNPLGDRPDPGDARWRTVRGERAVVLTAAELGMVLTQFGDFLVFPAHRAPVRRAQPAAPAAIHDVVLKVSSRGLFVGDPSDGDGLALLAYLLRTGSVPVEHAARGEGP